MQLRGENEFAAELATFSAPLPPLRQDAPPLDMLQDVMEFHF